MGRKSLNDKAMVSAGRTYICSTCPFRTIMLEFPVCKQCHKHFIEAYKKGYLQAKRDMKNKKKPINKQSSMWIYNKDDYFSDEVEYCYEITERELKMITELKPEDLLQHMKQAIGVMTPLGKTKLIPCVILGKIEISIQINYQLWSLRDDRGRNDNKPITQEELYRLVPNTTCRNIDVRIRYDNKPFVPATQMSLNEICNLLEMSIIGL